MTTSASFSAVLFDLGGVLTEDPFGTMAVASDRFGMDVREFAEIAIGRGDYGGGDHPWHQLERNEIDIDAYNLAVDQMAKQRGHAGFPPLPVDLIGGGLVLRPAMIELVADLRAAGLATGMVTNNVRALSSWRDMADWDSLLDIVIDSSAVGMRKPEARIFEHASAAVGAVPSEVIFLDDMQPNIDGAEAVGMTAVLVQDPADVAIERVRSLTGI